MGESNELFSTVISLKHKIESIEKIQSLNLRSNKTLYNEYISILKADTLLFQIYNEIDGIKSQKEIASIVCTSDMNVSNKNKKLLELGLIEIKEISKNKRIYKHSIIEVVFNLKKAV